MKVGIFRNSDGACDLYRATLPIMTASRHNACQYSEIWAANLLREVADRTPTFFETMASDIYLIQRLSGERLMKRIREFISELSLRTKIVMDHDDDLFNVSPLSNHYVDYGTKETKIVHNGNVLHEWKDGVNIDISRNIERLDEAKKSIELADLVTVTTDKLADVFRPYNDNIRVLPNCIDLSHWNKLNLVRSNPDEIRIGWAGGHSHWEDLFMIREPLIEIAIKYPNVKVVMVGYKPVSMEKSFRPGQIEFHDWVETPAHPFRLASLDIDIALVPLKKTPFSLGKSSVKWVEFSALQIPSISSFVSPYKEVAHLDGIENGVFVEENDKEGWAKGIEYLIEHPEERKNIGINARRAVEAHFDINKRYKEWILAYEEVLACQPLAIQR